MSRYTMIDYGGSESTGLLLLGIGLGAAWSWWATVAIGAAYLALTLKASVRS